MAERDLKLVIKAADEFSATLKKYSSSIEGIASDTSTSVGKIKGSLDGLKSHWLGATAVIIAAVATLKKAYDFASSAAAFEQQSAALDNLARQYSTSANSIINDVQRASDNTISKVEAITVANKGLMMGLDPATITRFTEVADALSDALGLDLAQSFDKLTTAAATGQERQLKQMGILVDLQGAYEAYAKSVHKTVDSLTEEEKQMAGVNAIMRESDTIMRNLGAPIMSAADEFDRFKTAVSDTATSFGNALLPAVTSVIGGINDLLGVTRSATAEMEKMMQTADIFYSKKALRDIANIKGGDSAETAKQAAELRAFFGKQAEEEAKIKAEANLEAERKYISSREMRSTTHQDLLDREVTDYSQTFFNVPDYDALEVDIVTREQNMVSNIAAAREEHQAQFAAAKMDTPWLLTEEQLSAIQTQKEMMFEMESNYEDMLLDRHLAYSEQAMQIERNLQQTKMNLQFGAANQAAALLSIIGQRNKAAAYAALAVQKGLAIAQVFINTKQAAALAMATVPPPAGEALAASIETWGAVQMGLIAATGLAEAAMGGGGGPSGIGGGGGVGALPITPPALSSEPTQGGETKIEINIINPMGNEDWDALAEDAVIPAFNRAVDRAVVVKATTIGG